MAKPRSQGPGVAHSLLAHRDPELLQRRCPQRQMGTPAGSPLVVRSADAAAMLSARARRELALFGAVYLHSTYAAHVLPALILIGLGLGLAMAPAMNVGTLGVGAMDSGVASAMVNTMQPIGGSLGTALLSTLSASATAGYLAGKAPSAAVAAQATVHGYTVAFWWTAAIFAAGALVCGLLLRGGAPQPEPEVSPAPAF
jgi:hypothetical protein